MNTLLEKYATVILKLERDNISFDGLVDGLVQTAHNSRPDYKLKQNPTWWVISSTDEIYNSIVNSLIK